MEDNREGGGCILFVQKTRKSVDMLWIGKIVLVWKNRGGQRG